MKKITLLLLLITTFSFAQTIDIKNFKVNEPANQTFDNGLPVSSRFDFEFDIRGDYSWSTNSYHQIDLIVYKGNSTNESNALGRIYWNREDDYDIIYPNYFKKQTWFNTFKDYNTNPGQAFTLKVVYGNTTEIYTYTYPNTGNPDLVIDAGNTTIDSGCSQCNRVLADIGSSRYLAKPSSAIFIGNISVKNMGTATSVASNVRYFLSSNSTYDASDQEIGSNSNFSTISPNDSRITNGLSFDYFTISGALGINNGNSNILLVVDKKDVNDFNPNESNENNNVTVIPIRISSSNAANLKFDLSDLNNNNIRNPYSIEIYSFTGQKVLSKNVNNIEEENEATLQLPKGLYIIKSEKGDRKVYVNK